MEKEFKNDGSADKRIPPKEKAKEVAEIWGEGYEPLINLLEICIKNNIRTMGCCAGHSDQKFGYPYVYFENKSRVSQYILEQMSKERSTDEVGITRNDILGTPAFVLRSNIGFREEFFNKITQYIEHYIEQNKGKRKILRVKTLEQPSKQHGDISIIRRIALLTNSKNFGISVVYEPKYKLFHFDCSNVKYSETEMKRKRNQEFLIDKDLMVKEPLIKRLKDLCQNSEVSFSKIVAVFSRITRINYRNRKTNTKTINSS